MAKKARKKSKAKTVKRGKPKGLKRPRSNKLAKTLAKKRVKKPARAKRQPAKGAKPASAFQIMIDTINESERLRAKNERRDVTDEMG